MSGDARMNTDREIWRGPDDGNGSFYADSIHVTEQGGIGINCGGHVIVMSARDWHKLGVQSLQEKLTFSDGIARPITGSGV